MMPAKNTKNALVYNANSFTGQELVKVLSARGYEVVAADSEGLALIDELTASNPELEGKYIEIPVSKDETAAEFEEKAAAEGITHFDIVIDLNRSSSELVSDDYRFISAAINSTLVDDNTVVCLGNSEQIVSRATFRAATEFVKTLEKEFESKNGFSKVINMLYPDEPSRLTAKAIAGYYVSEIIRSAYKIKRIASFMDFIYTAIYYALPLSLYPFIEESGKALKEFTSPVPLDVEPDLLN